MRLLVACPACRRQFDASGLAAGARFACSCGAALVVPAPRARDAAVVRCSSCGAPRSGPRFEPEAACRYCGSDFTLHERDLDTLCPGCMARVSGKSRFCHFCATPLLLDQAAAAAAAYGCPSCRDRKLASRRLGAEAVALFECRRCGGVWLEKAVFEMLVERARLGRAADLGATLAVAPEPGGAVGGGPLYRPCAVCGALMNRLNYGRKSGVILDVCGQHGVWFDLRELERILAWVRAGGPQKAHTLAGEEERAAKRHRALFAPGPADGDPEMSTEGSDGAILQWIAALAARLAGVFR